MTDIPGTRVPPIEPGKCPCCGFAGKRAQRACVEHGSDFCRRCRVGPGACVHASDFCPGPGPAPAGSGTVPTDPAGADQMELF